MSKDTMPDASEPVARPLQRPVGRLPPERTDVDALLADPSYYEPRISKKPLTRGCSECAWGKVLGCWRCGGR